MRNEGLPEISHSCSSQCNIEKSNTTENMYLSNKLDTETRSSSRNRLLSKNDKSKDTCKMCSKSGCNTACTSAVGHEKCYLLADEKIERFHEVAPKWVQNPNVVQRILGVQPWTLTSYYGIQVWEQDNQYIEKYYRLTGPDWGKIWQSLFYLHNQSANVYSHGLAVVGFMLLGWRVCFHWLPQLEATHTDFWVWPAFFVSCCLCFAGSVGYHLTWCHSSETYFLGGCWDWSGIVLIWFGCMHLLVYQAFPCDPYFYVFYTTMLTVNALAFLSLVFKRWFHTAKNRALRVKLVCSLGVSTVLPLMHYVYLHGPAEMVNHLKMHILISEVIVLFVGASLYAHLLPESRFPGVFDLIGSSHNIHHVTSTAAVTMHCYAMWQTQLLNAQRGCPVQSIG
ncbi:hypothetical protein SARC_10869 [Sphaeroforma arctica JP610]|uniref:Uncharacterized protein n=1 Tax=Sphaeroforma arctica JP610 TaxID=667725 RepID=A0A0L0FKV3_9EUKA|nr:hypothetical protein SARC_10869 [Sphaeroforma arctica JP610]KNC76638.1 hypothetical protein SARC_10869 [Sphaeroforma arctica JP610]|eukprot:XP_014150540.1 hypothetical protein SARC_10869 [Sphaeroforma arctica JP610]